MRIRKNLFKENHQSTRMRKWILIFIISNMFLLSACITSNETTKETVPSIQESLTKSCTSNNIEGRIFRLKLYLAISQLNSSSLDLRVNQNYTFSTR